MMVGRCFCTERGTEIMNVTSSAVRKVFCSVSTNIYDENVFFNWKNKLVQLRKDGSFHVPAYVSRAKRCLAFSISSLQPGHILLMCIFTSFVRKSSNEILDLNDSSWFLILTRQTYKILSTSCKVSYMLWSILHSCLCLWEPTVIATLECVQLFY